MQPGKRARARRSFSLDDAADLTWIWTEAESELGVRSSFGTMLERASAGQLFEERAASVSEVLPHPGASKRFRRISHALEELRVAPRGLLHARVLHAVYGPPPRLGSPDDLAQKALRSDRGLVLRHLPELRELAETRHRGNLRTALESESKAGRLLDWAIKARAVLDAARAAYAAARLVVSPDEWRFELPPGVFA